MASTDLPSAAAPGERAVAVAGPVVDSVIVTGDNADIRLGLGAPVGAVLALLGLRGRPRKKARRTPLARRPARFANHLDRISEGGAIVGGPEPVNLYGSAGLGKTYVLADALNRAEAMALPDGVVYVYGRGKSRADLLQALFEEFYDCRPPFKATEAQIGADLAKKRALVVIDSAELERDDVQQLAAAAPQCRFVVASRERSFWEGRPVKLEGLKLTDALALVEQELGRPLEPQERPHAEQICRALNGHPLEVRQAVAITREDGRRLTEVAAQLAGHDPKRRVAELALRELSDDEMRVLEALALLRGAAVGAEHIAPIAGLDDATTALARLERRRLVESHSPRHSIADNLVDSPALQNTRAKALDRALAYFSRWTEQNRERPRGPVRETEPLLELLRAAVAAGRFAESIRLGRALDAAFAWARRFGAWGQLHELVLEAARKANDRAAEAWALHQRGTHAAALQEEPGAGDADLEQAAQLRRQLGDARGAEASEANRQIGQVAAIRPRWPYRALRRILPLTGVTIAVTVGFLALASGGGAGIWYTVHNGHDHRGGGQSLPLVIVKYGTGQGTVSDAAGALDCGASCRVDLAPGTRSVLRATAAKGSRFARWTGGCTGSRPTCEIIVHGKTTVTATFSARATAPLHVRLSGSGRGAVRSAPAGIDCGRDCEARFAVQSSVVLTAAPAAGSVFAGWSGGCSGAATCAVPITGARSVTATFRRAQKTRPLEVHRTGSGSGRISSAPDGIDCPSRCDAPFARGHTVVLTARAETGSVFAGWSGDCSGTANCRVRMTEAKSVTASFEKGDTTRVLTVTLTGNGVGKVESNPSGVLCPGSCSASFDQGGAITLTASATPGSTFAGWTGAACGTEPVCKLTLDANANVTASFNAVPTVTLTVVPTGGGQGVVLSEPPRIDCGNRCHALFEQGSRVRLDATAAQGSEFVGWSSNDCTGTKPCELRLDKPKRVVAIFKRVYVLTVHKDGAGTVVADQGVINCGNTCADRFRAGSQVRLTATADAGWLFTGWGGGCIGTGVCDVTILDDVDVTAVFKPAVTLTVTNDGGGVVTSSPQGISCPKNCSARFAQGSTVQLTADAARGYVFSYWKGGNCGRENPCRVRLDASVRVFVIFRPASYALTVDPANGGAVVSGDGRINCGTLCQATFSYGTTVTLTAKPMQGMQFDHWTGDCKLEKTTTCKLTITAPAATGAVFTQFVIP